MCGSMVDRICDRWEQARKTKKEEEETTAAEYSGPRIRTGGHEKKKNRGRNLTVAKWVIAESSHIAGLNWNVAWLAVFRRQCYRSRFITIDQAVSELLGVEILPFPIDLDIVLYNRLYYCTSREKSMFVHMKFFSLISLSSIQCKLYYFCEIWSMRHTLSIWSMLGHSVLGVGNRPILLTKSSK